MKRSDFVTAILADWETPIYIRKDLIVSVVSSRNPTSTSIVTVLVGTEKVVYTVLGDAHELMLRFG